MPEGCPAQDPLIGATLLNHLSRPNVRKFGLQIRGRSRRAGRALDVLDRGSRRRGPFCASSCARSRWPAAWTSTWPRRACAQLRVVAARRRCRRARACPRWILEEACQKAIDAGMVMHRAHPLNCDVPCGARGRRRHAECAVLHAQQLAHARSRRRDLPARDRRPRRAVAELHDSRSRTCDRRRTSSRWSAPGNGRALFDPARRGREWGLGAVSTAEWTGVPLVEILDRAGVRPEAKEVLFLRRRIAGRWSSGGGPLRAQPDRRRARQTMLLAYAMNGEPLPVEHGSAAPHRHAGTRSRRSSG